MIIDCQAQLKALHLHGMAWLPPDKNGKSKEMHDKSRLCPKSGWIGR